MIKANKKNANTYTPIINPQLLSEIKKTKRKLKSPSKI